ncbi:MAG: hypothetical protein KDC71_24585, partial [Acidobacteria bacterium]|nr:hypothetical protein [Acidobacteriota bacterium]
FQVWRPHIFADFHEMGSQQSFFFQPGDPQRTNPLTPPENQRLTAQIAEFHAQAFDQLAHPYFTREQYDDFFYGKGSTYPDIQGAIGILFEQGSARGHLMRSPYGPRSLAQAMENHLAASLSTLKAAVDLHDQILAYSQSFEALRQKNIQAEKRAGFVFTSRDPYRSKAFVDLLGQHRIKAFRLAKSTSLNSILFEPESSWYVPLDQDQYSLIRTCFERQTEFASQVFYDISGWTLAAAYGLRFAEISKKDAENLAILTYPEPPPNPTPLDPKAVAYVISWEHGLAAPAIADLVQADQKVFTSSEPFQLGTQQFPAGSAWVLQSEVARTRLTAWQSKGLPVFNAASGLTQNGPAWGSPSLHKVEKPKILLLVGEGMSAYDCGELWFHLIQKLGLTPTLLDVSDWSKIDLAEYSHLFLTQWPEVLKVQKESDRIKDWIQAGGQLYAQKSALPELAKLEWSKILLSKAESEGSWKDYREKQRPWSEKESFASEYAVNGLLANVQIDLTNPICFGLEDQSMAFFTQNNRFFEVPKDSFSAPIRFSTDPVYSGYLGKENRERIANSPYLISIRLGSGQILAVQGTPTFRGFCLGSEKIIANLLFQTSP